MRSGEEFTSDMNISMFLKVLAKRENATVMKMGN
jgi:hypothetical protein